MNFKRGGDTLEKRIKLENDVDISNVFGDFDVNIKIIEKEFKARVFLRENEITVSAGEVSSENLVNDAYSVLKHIVEMAKKGEVLTKQTITYLCELAKEKELEGENNYSKQHLFVTSRGKTIKPKTYGQSKYLEQMKKNDIVFGIGPAGTGKTFLAVLMAVLEFKAKKVGRIILTRPAVEAGEKLGFLPGDLQDKVDPYLRPLYDSLYDIMGSETYLKHIEKGCIEIVPLAYMRGRTLDDSFIILDEAQNTTCEQMKMFLTRIGFGSKVVVTGDITQIDLPKERKSGLLNAIDVLKDVEGIEFVNLSYKDVVRHEIVKKIINAYDAFEEKKKG